MGLGQPLAALVACIHTLPGTAIRPERLDAVKTDSDDTEGGDFALADVGSAKCPLGYKEPLDESECRNALKSASAWMPSTLFKGGASFSTGKWKSMQRGCFRVEYNGAFLFNQLTDTGASGAGQRLICKKDTHKAAPPPKPLYHLAPMGADKCDSGETPRHWDCEAAAKIAIAAAGISTNGEYQESAWPHVPRGCSVREGNGKTHYSHKMARGNRNNGVHQLVCSGPPVPKPVGFCIDLEPPSTWGGSTCATIAASVKSNPDDNYCKKRDNTSAKIWNQVKCAKSCDGCKWTTTWDWEPPSTWGATCATIAASIKSNPDDNYCRKRGHTGKPWNDVYCAKTCVGIEAKPKHPDMHGENCGKPCRQWERKGGVCDWCGLHKGQEQHCCRIGYNDPGCENAEGSHQWFHSCVTVRGSVVKTMSAEEPIAEEPLGSGSTQPLLTFMPVVVASFIFGVA